MIVLQHCKERHGIKLPLRPETPPESLKIVKQRTEVATNSVSPTGGSFKSEQGAVKIEEALMKTGPQTEQKQGLITEWVSM